MVKQLLYKKISPIAINNLRTFINIFKLYFVKFWDKQLSGSRCKNKYKKTNEKKKCI